ncbi:MAG: OmpA family protein [candidate division Zixibacteria bacterium]|nr:OmpA family protein [candidate division Zixibacteria bacterium]
MRKSTSATVVLCVLLAAALLAGSAVADAKDNLTYQGSKARITVGNIKSKASRCSRNIAASIEEMLGTALTNTGRFIVLANQEEVGELIDEIELGQSEYTEEGRGADKGLMEGADILITGAITAFEPKASGGGGGLGGITKKAFGKIGVKKSTAKIQIDLKIIDIRTRRYLKAMALEGKSDKWKTNMAGGGRVDGLRMIGDLGVYSNEPMEKAVRAVLAKAVEEISKEIPQEYYRYTGQGQYTTQYGDTPSGGGTQQAAPSSQGGETPAQASTTPSAPAVEDMTLYTKYDFVPGNKVIFYDDMKDEEEGEFPYRWNLKNGVYEVVRLGKEFWIMATDNGTIRPKMPDGPLPEKYTVEMEFYNNGKEHSGNYFYIRWVDAKGSTVGELGITGSTSTWLSLKGDQLASKTLRTPLTKGIHTMRIMATNRSIKCYIDQERVANVPKIDDFGAVGFSLYHRPYSDAANPTLFRGFRFAEGGKSMREQLDEDGKIVTHGILFDPGSHVIKGESFKTLKNIGRLFEDDPGLRLSIEGHTDSDGSEEHNVTLSQNRAKAVLDYLVSKFSIGAGQLESKGWGESKPIGTNDTSEGKANNRRVELVKL